jgi:hypothetical protein
MKACMALKEIRQAASWLWASYFTLPTLFPQLLTGTINNKASLLSVWSLITSIMETGRYTFIIRHIIHSAYRILLLVLCYNSLRPYCLSSVAINYWWGHTAEKRAAWLNGGAESNYSTYNHWKKRLLLLNRVFYDFTSTTLLTSCRKTNRRNVFYEGWDPSSQNVNLALLHEGFRP